MRILSLVAAAGCLLALAASSEAAQLASPTIFGGFFQDSAQCTIGNLGTTPVTVTVDIVDRDGNVVPTDSHCGVVAPNFLCQVNTGAIAPDAALACTATTSSSVAKLRGSFAILGGHLPIHTTALR